jgi:Papain-like cysteine protease AvrRpt2
MNKQEVQSVDYKLDVPYFSQYKDVEGAELRQVSCGMTCAYMVLKYFGADVPTLDKMIERGIREGGYGPSGWIHDYFVKLFKDLGFECERQENIPERKIRMFRQNIRDGNPVMISVVRTMWDRRDFHIVLLTGVRESEVGEIEGFFYHDPAGLRQDGNTHRYVPVPLFFVDWRRMAILPKKK